MNVDGDVWLIDGAAIDALDELDQAVTAGRDPQRVSGAARAAMAATTPATAGQLRPAVCRVLARLGVS